MTKRVLMISSNFYPEPTGIGKYNGEMISWLAEHGYDCTVITGYPYYPYWKVQEPYHKDRFWYKTEYSGPSGKVKVCRCPMYVPLVPSGFKRILLDLSFLLSAFFRLLMLLLNSRFDYVITVVPSFHVGLLGIFLKKICNAKLLYHIQDLQIEAARDLQMIKSETVINVLFKLEKYIFSQSDIISSISEGMTNRIREKARKEVHLMPNWTDNKVFYPVENKIEIRKQFGLDMAEKVVLYSGAIGEKQGLESILYAAKEFKYEKSLKFVICGSGPYKKKLQSLAENLKLKNVIFNPLQPPEKFNLFLNLADLHLVIQKSSANDLVMPSKLTTIFGVGGLALITAGKGTSLHSYVSKNNLGLLIEPENQEALNEAIRKITTVNYSDLRKNARNYAEEHLSIEKIMKAYCKTCLEANYLLNTEHGYSSSPTVILNEFNIVKKQVH